MPPGEDWWFQRLAAAGLLPFAGRQRGPFRLRVGGHQVNLPAGLREEPGGNQSIAPVVALAENRGAVARSGKKLAHGLRHFAAGLFHERFRARTCGEGGPFECLHL